MARLDGRSWAPDPDRGRVVAFDGALRGVRIITSPVFQPVAVSPFCGHLLVSEYTGQAELLDTAGRSLAGWEGPFPVSLYAAGGCRLLAGRSPYVTTPSGADSVGALVVELDSTGHGTAGLGDPSGGPGALAVDSAGTFYFASRRARSVTRYTAGGAPVWTAAGPPAVAATLGPDGRLYVLGTDGRLDVLDTATGATVATRHLGPRETAVALDARGALLTLDADSLLGEAERTAAGSPLPFSPPFALPDLRGDTVRLAQYAGKVTLVNFWASWCGPCREEFPHMATLYGKFSRKDFDIAAISDDVDRGAMRAFVAAFHPPFPILVGGGRMREAYHYRGLPYSVLLDRHGRIVERLFGFGGEREFQELSLAIAKEIAAP